MVLRPPRFTRPVTLVPYATRFRSYIADTSQQAVSEHLPHFEPAMARSARERGFAPPNMPQYLASTAVDGAFAVGSPEQVAEKILFQHEIFGNDRDRKSTRLNSSH